MNFLRYYRNDLIVTTVVGVMLFVFIGWAAIPVYLLLVVVEVTLSGDNATVNVRLLKLLSRKWVLLFMTVGVLIAAGFMRFLFPILIVAFTGHMSFAEAVQLAFTDHQAYAEHVEAAHPQIAVFGGVYLLMIAANFFVVENTEHKWIPWFENPLARVGAKIQNLAPIITIIVVLGLSATVSSTYQVSILLAGFISLVSYMIIKVMADLAQDSEKDMHTTRVGWKAFGIFMALEAQDAAFSFDGVSGALAITQDPIIIAAGLGVGALFVRSATKHLMETNKLQEFRYLGHAAFYAILVLAVSQLVSLFVDIPGYIVGAISVAIIVTGVVHSHILNKREGTDETMIEEALGVDVRPVQH